MLKSPPARPASERSLIPLLASVFQSEAYLCRELPLDLQSKLLRVLQEGEFERVGGTQTFKVNVRVIPATSLHLELEARLGRFRRDLFERLNFVPVREPPLRERREDIPELVRYMLGRVGRGKPAGKQLGVDPLAEEQLEAYAWPGNVRELDNVINRAYILADGEVIATGDLPPEITRLPPARAADGTPDATVGLLRDQLRRMEVRISAVKS